MQNNVVRKWSPEQEMIFDWYANGGKGGKKNAMVEALAGTGKTTTIREGFRRAKENRMLYAVFGSRNKDEAKEKITDPRVTVSTLHSLGLSFIKDIWHKAHVPRFPGAWGVEADRIKACAADFPPEFYFLLHKLVSLLKNYHVAPTLDDAQKICDLKGIEIYGEKKNWNEKFRKLPWMFWNCPNRIETIGLVLMTWYGSLVLLT